MNDMSADRGMGQFGYRVFTAVKYATYLALCFNICFLSKNRPR